MEIPKAYEPQSVEDKWYDFWVKQGCFTANAASAKPAYSIVIPPPNVTGMLHMGHVLNNTIQDILSRKARMDGKEVLWLPGTDHAGIATQVQVEKALRKEEKKTKYDLGREEFLKRVWAWKEKHGGIIINQLKKLGCSCDWTRERFTMDPEYSRCVQKVFVDLYKKGLIYRGKRMVNWCPASLTALSDEEVEMEPQKGFLYYFRVEVAEVVGQASSLSSSSGFQPESVITSREGRLEACPTPTGKDACATAIRRTDIWLTIATTRPETIPGDTAVAVNPKDPRYASLIGKHVLRPLPAEYPPEKKLIPIIGDEHIDIEFGTGVLKVTPAHDKADFEIGQRHKLAAVDIMEPNARMNDLAGADLAGLDRFEARKVAVEKLRALGALVKEEPYENKVGFSQRARVPIEPRLSEQWFLKYPSVEKSKACVEQEGSAGGPPADSGGSPESSLNQFESGERVLGGPPNTTRGPRVLPAKMRFHPQRWAKVYDHWLTNIQDWCISRQLWWGHRIPVWSITCEGKQTTDVFHILDQCLSETLEDLLKDKGKESAIRIINAETGVLLRPNATEFNHGLNGVRVHVQVASVDEKSIASLEGNGFTQDPDVLDTWFSSWLWPFATMGWTGDKAQDSSNATLQKFYPTTDLVTGPDIIFFWVARMIMAGYEFMGDLPFRNVYFTGIIRDKQGRKMSKTLGNSPDPLELIAKYGADALRFGTMRGAPLGQDVLFDEKDVELGRNFCNKLWNACRFRQMQGGEVQGEINPNLLRSDDKWILLKLDQAVRELTESLATYNFSQAAQAIYRFFWNEYCDWYVETTKSVLGRPPEPSPSPLNGESAGVRGENGSDASHEVKTPPHPGPLPPSRGGEGDATRANVLAVIDFVLSHTLRLFHPFMPFITEELWHSMGFKEDMPADQGGTSIMTAPWPKPFSTEERDFYSLDDCYLEFANAKFEVVTQGRNLRREANLPSNKKVKFVLKPAQELSDNDREVIRTLLNAEAFDLVPDYAPAKGTPTTRTPLGELYLPLEGLVDVGAETARLKKELEKFASEIGKIEAKLNNAGFVAKAPPQVIEQSRKQLEELQAKSAHAKKALETLGAG